MSQRRHGSRENWLRLSRRQSNLDVDTIKEGLQQVSIQSWAAARAPAGIAKLPDSAVGESSGAAEPHAVSVFSRQRESNSGPAVRQTESDEAAAEAELLRSARAGDRRA